MAKKDRKQFIDEYNQSPAEAPDTTNEGEGQMPEENVVETSVVKKPAFCDVSADANGVVSFTFGNGETLTVNPQDLPEEQQENLLRHGLVQKVRDSFASAKGNYAFAMGAAEKVINQLKANQWTASRGSGDSKPKIGELVRALASLKGLELDVVQGAVERATDEKRKAWRNTPQVKAEIARIRAEDARKRADVSKVEDIDLDLAA